MEQTFNRSQTTRPTHNSQHKKPKVIKRYGNRKLYDTEQSAYVVLSDIAKMIKNREEVRIIDNETKDDITSATLKQIIFSAEKKSRYSTPLEILKNIIKTGDGSMSHYLGSKRIFKASPVDAKTLERDRKQVLDSVYYGQGRGKEQVRQKSIPERVASAALNPQAVDNEKTILPTQKRDF